MKPYTAAWWVSVGFIGGALTGACVTWLGIVFMRLAVN